MRVLLILFLSCMTMIAFAQNENPFLKKSPDGQLHLTEAGASHFASLALSCLQQEYPNKLNQVLKDSTSLKSPKELHPAFYGCFDWHSSVHGHWMLIKLLKQFPDLAEAKEIKSKLGQSLSKENLLAEAKYFNTSSKSWERMYGWSWLLKLAEELYTWKDIDGQQWSKNIEPLAAVIVERYQSFLPIQKYPVRTGVHPNTAFGLSYAWDYANTLQNLALKHLIEQRAKDYYLQDEGCPAKWEPSGEDFLSACLEEANLMSRILSNEDFEKWFKKFLPKKQLLALAIPADVSDRSDPKIVHLDGLNLSRAWSMYHIYHKIDKKKTKAFLLKAADAHLKSTVPNIAAEYYEGGHWLASFVVYALSVGK